MRLLVTTLALCAACGGGGGNGGDGGGPPGGDPPEPLEAICDRPERVDMSGAAEVATEGELRAALLAGGKILMTADIAITESLEIGADAVLDGGGFAIDGQDQTHILHGRMIDVTVQNVTLRNGNNHVSDDEHFSRRSGAALRISGGNGTTDGPATGSLTVLDVVFESNRTKKTGPGDIRGGALYVFNLPNTTIAGATFVGNQGSNGGAIGGLGSSLSIIESVFQGNATNGEGPGGALEGHGGAISLDALSQNGQTAYLNICGSQFMGNESRNTGGAIYLVTHAWQGNQVTIDQSLFDSNRNTSDSEGQGGAIYLQDDDNHEPPAEPVASAAQITATTFVDNEIYNRGAGVWYWTNDGHLTVENTTFVGNHTRETDGMGGGLAVSNGPATVRHCTFADNYAQFHGGGIQMSMTAVVTMQNTLFYNNSSNREMGYANFHTNRAVDVDLGGNMQFTRADLIIDSNSDALVSADAVRADALLLDLADNGGPVPTMALGAGSPAIDAGVADDPLAEDERGVARDALPDIGAFEVD